MKTLFFFKITWYKIWFFKYTFLYEKKIFKKKNFFLIINQKIKNLTIIKFINNKNINNFIYNSKIFIVNRFLSLYQI